MSRYPAMGYSFLLVMVCTTKSQHSGRVLAGSYIMTTKTARLQAQNPWNPPLFLCPSSTLLTGTAVWRGRYEGKSGESHGPSVIRSVSTHAVDEPK